MQLKALIFDVDGTLAETEEIHRKAFNRAFIEAELDWHWDRECYRKLLSVSGGKERIQHYIATAIPGCREFKKIAPAFSIYRPSMDISASMHVIATAIPGCREFKKIAPAFSIYRPSMDISASMHVIATAIPGCREFSASMHVINENKLKQENLKQWIASLHQSKTRHYADIMATGEVELRPGVERLITEAHAEGLRLAIATTTTMSNITALFDATVGREVLDWFEVIGAAEQAAIKKPDPSVYLWVLQQLGLAATACLAIEDTSNGVHAAKNAGIPVLVTQSYYSEGEDFSGALAVLSHLGEPDQPYQTLAGIANEAEWVTPEQLQRWLATKGSRKNVSPFLREP